MYIYIYIYICVYIYTHASILPCQAAKQLAKLFREGGHLQQMPKRAYQRLVEKKHRKRGIGRWNAASPASDDKNRKKELKLKYMEPDLYLKVPPEIPFDSSLKDPQDFFMSVVCGLTSVEQERLQNPSGKSLEGAVASY